MLIYHQQTCCKWQDNNDLEIFLSIGEGQCVLFWFIFNDRHCVFMLLAIDLLALVLNVWPPVPTWLQAERFHAWNVNTVFNEITVWRFNLEWFQKLEMKLVVNNPLFWSSSLS